MTLAATLEPHPKSRSVAVRSVRARLDMRPEGLAISYTVEGDLARVRVPPACSPRFADGLWKHTCCECFIAVGERPEYHELNFSPSGAWAAYAFSGYREGGRPLNLAGLDPKIAVRRLADRLDLGASIALDRLAMSCRGSALRIGLSAVIEAEDGTLSYWALEHPGANPDFHWREGFVLTLARPAPT